MTELARQHSQRDALNASAHRGTGTRYSDMINRYLAVASHRTADPDRHTAAQVPGPRTGGLVVVGVDDTPTSYLALDHAAIEADPSGWDLRIVHVLRSSGRHSGHHTGSQLLERLTDRVRTYWPSVAVTTRLIAGQASALLLNDATTADLVVVGHRHSATATAFGLTVGDRVAAGHRGTVLVVRMPGWPPGPEFGHRPIVVGVDHAPSPAVAFAMEEARVRGCDVVMLHAGAGAEKVDRLDLVAGVHVHHRNVPDDPATALITASEKAAALVVGRSGMIGIPASLGSVSRAMIQRAHCPVFLVG